MAALRIALDDGVAQNHHAKLTEGQDLVPAGNVIALVHGDGAEPASREFLQRLKDAAALVGAHTDAVRAAVKQNADALKDAAAALQESDEASAADLRTTTAIIDQTAADTTHEDVRESERYLREEATSQEAATTAPTQSPASAQSPASTSHQESAAGPNL